jgi:hypothetical protein
MSEQPKYVLRDADLLTRPPFKMEMDLYLFLLDADWEKLNAICDRELNLGGPTVYRPLLPCVVLYCSYSRVAPSENPRGWCPEKDFGFWIPVVAGHYEGPLFVPERVLTYTPYIWVDNGIAHSGGRELFGFFKQVGRMTMPRSTSDPAVFTVDTMVIPRWGADAECVERPILDVRRRDATLWEEIQSIWTSGLNLLDFVGEVLERLVTGEGRLPVPDPAFVVKLLKEIGKSVPMVFLKQFPDVGSDERACYQAIVEAPIRVVSDVKGGNLKGEYAVTVWSYDSQKIVDSLGLRPIEVDGNRAVMASLADAWMKFDAQVDTGTVLWKQP